MPKRNKTPPANEQTRTLKSGRGVPEFPETTELRLSTRCPRKWVSIDLETGESWAGSSSGWRPATLDERDEAGECLTTKSDESDSSMREQIDHAAELRRFSRKVGYPAGDITAVMLQAANEIDRLRDALALTDAANANKRNHENASGLVAGESDKASPTNQRQHFIEAPFTAEQVQRLNEWQVNIGDVLPVHPFNLRKSR